jgi:hypothetical protein
MERVRTFELSPKAGCIMLSSCSRAFSIAALAIGGFIVSQPTAAFGQVGRGGAGAIDLTGLIDASDVIPDEQPANTSRRAGAGVGGKLGAPQGTTGTSAAAEGDSGDGGSAGSSQGSSKSKGKRKGKKNTGGGNMRGGGGGASGSSKHQTTKKTTTAATSSQTTPKSAIKAYVPKSQTKAIGVGRRGGVGRHGGIGRQNASGAYTAHHGQGAKGGNGGGGGAGRGKSVPGMGGLGGGHHH